MVPLRQANGELLEYYGTRTVNVKELKWGTPIAGQLEARNVKKRIKAVG